MKYRTRGFSLVELSIVLVILGLLVGGVLSGQSLIHAAELRAVTEEYTRYTTAIGTFRDKYFALPGDMANATAFWGKDNTNCSTNTGTAATPGTCNGDGNGIVISSTGAGGATGESFQFWKQLALAGLLEGNYTGLAGTTTGSEVFGTNSPKSRMGKAGWGMHSDTNASYYTVDYGNDHFVFGASCAGCWGDQPVLKPEDAWNIDTKLDDGKPSSGRIVAIWWTNCTTSTTATDFTGTYNLLSSASTWCALAFTKAV